MTSVEVCSFAVLQQVADNPVGILLPPQLMHDVYFQHINSKIFFMVIIWFLFTIKWYYQAIRLYFEVYSYLLYT